MLTPNDTQDHRDFHDPMFANDKGTAELRMQVPRRLLEIFDAVSMARGQERFQLVIEELSKSADRWVHEASLIHRVTRSNPALMESSGVNSSGSQTARSQA